MEMALPIISLFIGLLARIFVPWLAKRRQNPAEAEWSWKVVWPQLLGFGLVILVLPLVISDLKMIAELPAQAAWILGWGAADLGRQTYKAFANEAEE